MPFYPNEEQWGYQKRTLTFVKFSVGFRSFATSFISQIAAVLYHCLVSIRADDCLPLRLVPFCLIRRVAAFPHFLVTS